MTFTEPRVASVEDPSRPGDGRRRFSELDVTVAFGVSFLMALQFRLPHEAFGFRLPHEIPIGYLVAIALLPVTGVTLVRYRGALLIVVLSVVAAITGSILTVHASAQAPTDRVVWTIHTVEVVGIAVATMALLWARTAIGTRNTVFMYGLGMLASVAVTGVNPSNPWKFSFSVPLVLLALSLPRVYRNRGVESIILVSLALVSVVLDSRSAGATMLIAAVLILVQGRPDASVAAPRKRGRPVRILVRVVVIVLAGAYLLQQAILEGTVGTAVQERTIKQIDTSGSLLFGGRPEIGATAKLLLDQPWGYGAGTMATRHNFDQALGGMVALGYSPEGDRYIQVYMLGQGFEVHSLAGDLWILFGVAGALLALVLGLYFVFGIARSMSQHLATGVLLYLALRSTWDLAFSPILASMDTLPLTIAVVLAVQSRTRTRARWFRSRRDLDLPPVDA